MDGTQVLKTLKENHKHLEIIMLTGHATIDSAVESTKLGAFKCLEKPHDFEKLVEVIKKASEARLKKKFEHNQKRIEEIQKLSIGASPLGLLRALARLENEEKQIVGWCLDRPSPRAYAGALREHRSDVKR